MPAFNRRTFLGSTAALASLPALTTAAEQAESATPLGKTPHTKFAVNIEMWWKKLDFLDRIRAAASLGYPAFEFWPWRKQEHRRHRQLVAANWASRSRSSPPGASNRA